MKKQTKRNLMISWAAVAGGILLYRTYKNRQEPVWVYKDHDMRNSAEVDRRESPDAAFDAADKGLTELDGIYRDEWQANGFPQTHRLDQDDIEQA